MAETMTYDPCTDTVTTENNLTEAEQESLKVGEEMEAQQEQLLAGKYRSAEDLEKAYVELQRKLGEESNQDNETTNESEVQESDEVSEEKEETKEDSPALALVNEAAAEYWDNDKTLSEETINKLGEMSGQDLLAAYLQAQKANPIDQNVQTDPVDLTTNDIAEVKSAAGGEKEYGELVQWAADNLERSSVEAFDELVSSGNVGAIKLAVAGLKAQYENVNGYEGTMLSGKPPSTSTDTFRSQAEVVSAMSDPRYEKDPAYRQDLMEKLERSDVKF